MLEFSVFSFQLKEVEDEPHSFESVGKKPGAMPRETFNPDPIEALAKFILRLRFSHVA